MKELALALETHEWAETSPNKLSHESELELKALALTNASLYEETAHYHLGAASSNYTLN